MKKTLWVLLIIIGLCLTGIGFLWCQNIKLLEALSLNNKVIGTFLDARTDAKVSEDISREGEPVYYLVSDWLRYDIEKVDLYGWDDPSIRSYMKRSETIFNQFLDNFKKDIDLTKARSFKVRVKEMESLIGKIRKDNQAEDVKQLIEYKDLGGIRIVTNTLDELESYKQIIKDKYKIKTEKDYINNPLISGYRSYHIILLYKDLPFEVQIRTCEMDIWANWAHNTLYKNIQKIIDQVGQEDFIKLEDYAREISNYIFNTSKGIQSPLPSPPPKLKVLRDTLPEKYKKFTNEDGTLNFESCKK